MPRGPLGGATAVLIRAVEAQGERVSRYQIERWRTAGELPRPIRRGLGRDRGVASEVPDAETVQKAVMLARTARRGSRRFGSHVIERLACGQAVREHDIRHAFAMQLDRIARMTGADVADEDAGWQRRRDAAKRAAREFKPVSWQDLLDAVDDMPERPEPSRDRRRSAATGVIHALATGDEAVSDDLIEMLGLQANLTQEQVEQLRQLQRTAELNGADPLGQLANLISIQNLRRIAANAHLDDLRRATAVVMKISTWQAIVVLLGLPDIAGSPIDLPAPLNRFNAAMVRRVQADPMWLQTNSVRFSISPKYRITQLALTALHLLAGGLLEIWEEYEQRLANITRIESSTHPEVH